MFLKCPWRKSNINLYYSWGGSPLLKIRAAATPLTVLYNLLNYGVWLTFYQRTLGQLPPVLRERLQQPFKQAAQVRVTPVQIENVPVRPFGPDLEEVLLLAPLADDEPADPVDPAVSDKHVDQGRPLEHRRCHGALSPACWDKFNRDREQNFSSPILVLKVRSTREQLLFPHYRLKRLISPGPSSRR